jgi:hypothetical protein
VWRRRDAIVGSSHRGAVLKSGLTKPARSFPDSAYLVEGPLKP